jgi:Protein of unknown function (DUF1091)
MDNYSAKVFNGSDGISYLSLTASIIERLEFIEVVTTYLGKNRQNDETYNKVHYNGTFNTCDVTEAIKTNFILKMVVENLQHYSNYTFKCPEMPGVFHVTDFPAISDQYLPHTLLGTTGPWKFTILATARVAKSDPLTHMLTVNVYGTNF